ncbi:exopolyphosphatase [Paraliobacillus quinghaiensis]|uniref:Exopolyphosphatase n=1 Tax=Paraliobacillus quinghaiensis TaxID=470815 RepID=A0A917WT93_9BACI|nr:Ppx/GppA family phosphatase [Paraliobacillus quinghaiensis]GGM30040.1 exopolyphosphatase [Paraliobacillus quinghaiensis]
MEKNYYAIIDIGSNTIRLVIYLQEKAGRLREVENVKTSARLRDHLDSDGRLTKKGSDILLHSLHNFADVIATYTLVDLVCVATATIRQATNNNELKKLVKEELNWDMRILSEQEEAFYGYLAVVNSTSIEEGITIDIGGGSTEVTYFKDRQLIHAHSFPFGTLTLRSYLEQDGQSFDKNMQALRRFLKEQFHSLPWLSQKNVPLIGIGGSARNLVQIDQNQKAYPLAGLHQYKMDDSDIAGVSNYLSSLSFKKLQKVEGLSKDRSDIIIPAIEAFHSLYQTIEADCFILSRKGLRDGVFYEILSQDRGTLLFPNVLEDSIQELINDYDLNTKQIMHVQFLTRQLFNNLKTAGIKSLSKKDWFLLKRASYVYNLGDYIDSESSSQHTFYLLANRTIDGLMHIDRLQIALIASFKNKMVFKQFIEPYKDWFLKQERKRLQLLGALLKFTYCLDATKRQVVQDFDLDIKSDTLYLTFYCNQNSMPEAYQSEKQKKHLEKALSKSIELRFITN